MLFIGRAWDRWQVINKVNGDFIAKVAVAVFYYTVCAAFACGALISSRLRPGLDPLNHKYPVAWATRRPVKAALDDARRQF